MALPRPVVLLAVLGVALLAATFYTVRGAREAAQVEVTSSSTPEPAAKSSAATSAKKAPAEKARPAGEAASSKGRDAAKPDRPDKAGAEAKGAAAGLPAGLARALARRDIVVLFFFQPGSADDAATARSVAAAGRHARRVSVFKAPLRNLGRYRRLIGELGVSQAPATVIVGRDRKARLLEGYVDERSLIQEVADSGR
jgi:hypothetical protein